MQRTNHYIFQICKILLGLIDDTMLLRVINCIMMEYTLTLWIIGINVIIDTVPCIEINNFFMTKE